ncbi:DNA mismatch repair protein MutS [Candidatus Magnetomoraceae bacterium gMMP-15]
MSEEVIEIPIDGTLDLHTFQPREVKNLIPDYVNACSEKGITRLHIIHGKGTGRLRQTVHAILNKMPEVDSFWLADKNAGAWGATVVVLKDNTLTTKR